MPTGVYPRQLRLCEVPDCGRKHLSRGFCGKHYYRFTKYGDASVCQKPVDSAVTSLECRRCLSMKPLSEYRYREDKGGLYERVCKSCNQEDTAKWVSAHREQVAATRRINSANKTYGPEGEAVARRIIAGEPCEVCEGFTSKMAIDHDHVTGEVRGLLCSNCNTALGLLRDSSERITSLLDYLERAAK